MRYLTAGESHGRAMLAIMEGFPANVPIQREKILSVLADRRNATGRSQRQKLEDDAFQVVAGMRNGLTLGSPLAVSIPNVEWPKWLKIMDPWSCSASSVTVPRPGHADLPGAVKYRQGDLRNIAERASARETVARTVVGAFALQLLERLGVEVQGKAVRVGPETISQAQEQGDTLGGIICVTIQGLPGGIGSHVHWDRRLDARLAAAVMGIQAVKGVEFAQAFTSVLLPGSQFHDEIICRKGRMVRSGNNAGGVEGGMSNGEPIVLRAAVKPIPTLDRPLRSFDRGSGTPQPAPVTRHDISAVGAAAVIARAVCAWEVAACLVEQFGGSTLEDLEQQYVQYSKRWKEETSCPGH